MDPSVTIIITLALVFYSIGVWSERISGINRHGQYSCFDDYRKETHGKE